MIKLTLLRNFYRDEDTKYLFTYESDFDHYLFDNESEMLDYIRIKKIHQDDIYTVTYDISVEEVMLD